MWQHLPMRGEILCDESGETVRFRLHAGEHYHCARCWRECEFGPGRVIDAEFVKHKPKTDVIISDNPGVAALTEQIRALTAQRIAAMERRAVLLRRLAGHKRIRVRMQTQAPAEDA